METAFIQSHCHSGNFRMWFDCRWLVCVCHCFQHSFPFGLKQIWHLWLGEVTIAKAKKNRTMRVDNNNDIHTVFMVGRLLFRIWRGILGGAISDLHVVNCKLLLIYINGRYTAIKICRLFKVDGIHFAHHYHIRCCCHLIHLIFVICSD